jgi:hypothetical protein
MRDFLVPDELAIVEEYAQLEMICQISSLALACMPAYLFDWASFLFYLSSLLFDLFVLLFTLLLISLQFNHTLLILLISL